MKYLVGILAFISLTGCMKDSTLVVENTHPEYVGYWFYQDEKSEPNFEQLTILSLNIKNNGQATYLKCEISNDTRANSSIKKRFFALLNDASVIDINAQEITLEQHWEFIHIEHAIAAPSRPFTENEAEYLYVEGYKLIKTNEKNSRICPE